MSDQIILQVQSYEDSDSSTEINQQPRKVSKEKKREYNRRYYEKRGKEAKSIKSKHCSICDKYMQPGSYNDHVKSNVHQAKAQLRELQQI